MMHGGEREREDDILAKIKNKHILFVCAGEIE